MLRDMIIDLIQIGPEAFEQVFHWHQGRQNKAAANHCRNDEEAAGGLVGL